MSTRAEQAKKYFQDGYACSQAVAMAFSDLVNVDEGDLSKMMLPFGGGFGRLRLVCGAVSGMTAIIGMIFAESGISPENKMSVYEMERELCSRFIAENGSLICKELLAGANLQATVGGNAETRSPEYYKKRPCGDIVYSAAKILEEFLKEKGVL